jgi:hypothetical protein
MLVTVSPALNYFDNTTADNRTSIKMMYDKEEIFEVILAFHLLIYTFCVAAAMWAVLDYLVTYHGALGACIYTSVLYLLYLKLHLTKEPSSLIF